MKLIGNRLVDNQSREGGFHFLHINHENEYNLLEIRISHLHEMADELDSKIKAIKLSPDYLSLRDKSVAQFNKLSLHLSNIIQVYSIVSLWHDG